MLNKSRSRLKQVNYLPLRFRAGRRRRRLNLSCNLSWFILRSCIFAFDDLYFAYLVVFGLVLC